MVDRCRFHCGRAFCSILLVLASLTPTGPARAQSPPSPGDTVRVRTPVATTTGSVLLVSADSLVIAHKDKRFGSPLTLSRSMLVGLDVKVGNRSRAGGALLGAGIGLLFTTLTLLVAKPSDVSWREVEVTDWGDRALLFGPPLAGAVIGASIPSAHWRAASLPAPTGAP